MDVQAASNAFVEKGVLWDRDSTIRYLRRALTVKKGGFVLVLGGADVGKSLLLSKLARELNDRGKHAIVIVDGRGTGTNVPQGIVDAVNAAPALSSWLSDAIEGLLERRVSVSYKGVAVSATGPPALKLEAVSVGVLTLRSWILSLRRASAIRTREHAGSENGELNDCYHGKLEVSDRRRRLTHSLGVMRDGAIGQVADNVRLPQRRHLQRALRPLDAVVVLARREAGAVLRLRLRKNREHAKNDGHARVEIQSHDALHGDAGGRVRGRITWGQRRRQRRAQLPGPRHCASRSSPRHDSARSAPAHARRHYSTHLRHGLSNVLEVHRVALDQAADGDDRVNARALNQALGAERQLVRAGDLSGPKGMSLASSRDD